MIETAARRTAGGSRGPATGPALLAAALRYAAAGWPVCLGVAAPPSGPRACSCDRIGCPAPGAHPTSPAWQSLATVEPGTIERWWAARPDANVILPTGRVFDVFDVPAPAGEVALAAMERAGVPCGPVAASGRRHLFFVATRGVPEDDDEWWSCHLDCLPETLASSPGLRWHCRDSYVVAPPSVLATGERVSWLRPPDGRPLPDPLGPLAFLTDACEPAHR